MSVCGTEGDGRRCSGAAPIAGLSDLSRLIQQHGLQTLVYEKKFRRNKTNAVLGKETEIALRPEA